MARKKRRYRGGDANSSSSFDELASRMQNGPTHGGQQPPPPRPPGGGGRGLPPGGGGGGGIPAPRVPRMSGRRKALIAAGVGVPIAGTAYAINRRNRGSESVDKREWVTPFGETVVLEKSYPVALPVPTSRKVRALVPTGRHVAESANVSVKRKARSRKPETSLLHITKADEDREPSRRRKATAAFWGPYHGAVAGKEGKKLRAAGNMFGYGTLGAAAGGGVGGLAGYRLSGRKPVGALAGYYGGAFGGQAVGNIAGVKRNQRKGYLKREDRPAAVGKNYGYTVLKADEDDKKPDHGKPTGSRRATAAAFGPWHSAVAGRRGHKLRATGNTVGRQYGGALLGGIPGAYAGRALGGQKGMVLGAQLGGAGGAHAGIQRAVTVNQRRGHYKPQS